MVSFMAAQVLLFYATFHTFKTKSGEINDPLTHALITAGHGHVLSVHPAVRTLIARIAISGSIKTYY